MPTYEYECSKCHHHFDAFQSMSSKPHTTCPEELCQMKEWGQGNVKRLLSAGAGLIFKGSGFYITDYRSEGYKNSAKSESSEPACTKSTEKPSSASTDAGKSTAAPSSSPSSDKKSSSEKV